jgi:replication factor A1
VAQPESEPGTPQEVRLADLRVGEGAGPILARVVTATRRSVVRRSDGGRRPVLSGLLSDGTATVPFTWWDPPAEGVDRGTVLRAGPVSVREYRGRLEVTFSWKTRVEPASDVELPKLSTDSLPPRTVASLRERDEGFRLDVRVVRVQPKSVSVGEERREIHEGILADGTGTVAFTAWTDFRLTDGEAVRVAGGYVRVFRNRPQLVLDERSRVERIDGNDLPTLDALSGERRLSIGEWEAARGGDLVSVAGTVVGLLPPSGVVYRCPVCGRSVAKGLCRVHGSVAGAPDLRARLVLDDGTGGATVNLRRKETEQLWGRTLEQALERLRATPDPSVLEEELFGSVFGRRLELRGRAFVDDFGLTIEPEEVRPAAESTAAAAARVARALEAIPR